MQKRNKQQKRIQRETKRNILISQGLRKKSKPADLQPLFGYKQDNYRAMSSLLDRFLITYR